MGGKIADEGVEGKESTPPGHARARSEGLVAAGEDGKVRAPHTPTALMYCTAYYCI